MLWLFHHPPRQVSGEHDVGRAGRPHAHNTEGQSALGDFKTILTDIILDGQEGHNRIADQMLKDERTFTVMQEMMARLVYAAFRERAGRPS